MSERRPTSDPVRPVAGRDQPTRDQPTRDQPTRDQPTRDQPTRDQPTVRTFTPRWRTSPLIEERIARLLPRYGVADGPLDARAAFGRDAPLVLEIGSGHGAAALAYARTHPQHDLLAVEVHVPGVARMLAAADDEGLSNLRVVRGDALALLASSIAPHSLEAVHLFFPDPWPKARHAKRRLVQQDTLDLIAGALRPGGALLLATDHEVYAAHALSELAAHGGFEVIQGERPPWRPREGFEAKGRAAGREIREIRAVRPA